jgi:hypothetical protein
MNIFINTIVEESVQKLRLANRPHIIKNVKADVLIYKLNIHQSLRDFYIHFIKPYKLLRLFSFYLYKYLNIFYSFYFRLIHGNKNVRWRPVVCMSTYISKTNSNKYTIYPNLEVYPDIYTPINSKYASIIKENSSVKELTFPEIYTALISNATVIGGSDLIVVQDYVICNDFLDLKNEKLSEEYHFHILLNKNLSKALIIDQKNLSNLILPAAATFLHSCSVNYAHWLSEVLPKVVIFCKDKRFFNIPIIIDENLDSNIFDSLLIVVGESRPIYILPKRNALRIEQLYVVSSVGYVPFEVRDQLSNKNFHGVFSKYSLMELKSKLAHSFIDSPNAKYPDKIYLKRDGRRNVSNFSDLSILLRSRGFVEVDPSKLSFCQQMFLFYNVREVVAPTGASIANLIFAKPGTIVFILMGIHSNMIYRYWINMLSLLGIKVEVILGFQEGHRKDLHDNYTIDKADLISALDNK